MADTKISAMTAATLPLTGTELVPIVQGGINKRTTIAEFDAYNRSYGSWSDSTDQIGSTVAGVPMTYNTADVTDGITLVGGSQITVPNTGIYDLQFSAQFQNTDTAFQDVYIWLKQNGVDIPGSTGFISVPNRHAGTDGHSIIGWNYFLSMAANDYIEIYWSVPNVAVTIQHLAASGTPTKPSTQSVVATMSFVSALFPTV